MLDWDDLCLEVILIQNMMQYIRPTLAFPLVLLMFVIYFIGRYWKTALPRRGTTDWIVEAARPPISFAGKRHRCDKKDAVAALVITAIYACTSLFQLGSNVAPQSFYRFENGQAVEIFLDEPTTVTALQCYYGLFHGEYILQFYQADGSVVVMENPVEQRHSQVFSWQYYTLEQPLEQVTGFAFTADRTLEMGELRIETDEGSYAGGLKGPAELFDEQVLAPEQYHWYNSSYFDEIYHARTAYEHIENVRPYEVTHPPLGKLIISIGIRTFGMTPFGWRIMGTLFGIGMVPIFYAFLKNFFGKRPVAIWGTVFFATDFMHLTQTRIATIDTYAVFFIILMYYFMYRYLTLPQKARLAEQFRELFLSGLFFGMGVASKWTVAYGAVGLALLYFVGMHFRRRDWVDTDRGDSFAAWCLTTLGASVFFFILVPLLIYTVSYIPYAQVPGEMREPFQIMVDNQISMFSYHSGVTASHPYESKWYMWLVDARPILYYLDSSVAGVRTSFSAFTNPLSTWAGLFAMILCAVRLVQAKSGRALFILVGYLAQLVPWIPISRCTFAYHYFPSMPFLILAICFLLDEMMEKKPKKTMRLGNSMAVVSTGLYAAFYPVLVGLPISVSYARNFLQWFPSWPI